MSSKKQEGDKLITPYKANLFQGHKFRAVVSWMATPVNLRRNVVMGKLKLSLQQGTHYEISQKKNRTHVKLNFTGVRSFH